VTGAYGMLGTALLPVLQERHQVWGVGSQECDIRRANAVAEVFEAHRPELVFHLAAYTDVDGCEADPQLADETNSLGTRNVAIASAAVGATLVYVSTDYVFDGSKSGAYVEDDLPNPINVYGRSKLLGEQHVGALLKRYFIVRTSWLFGPKGQNFVTTILKAARQQSVIRVVDDQYGSPTYTRHLAITLAELMKSGVHGIYHMTGSGACSRFEFAKSILDLRPVEGVEVLPISSLESGRAARRPANSVLESRALAEVNLKPMPHWRGALAEYLYEIGRSGRESET